MFKPLTIGYYKQVRNNPRCKAQSNVYPGMVVVLDEANKTASVPADAAAAQGKPYIVSNIIDKPEVENKADFVVQTGEYVRADYLADANELLIELDYRVIVTDLSTVAIGDVLVPANETDNAGNGGKWIKADGEAIVASSYAINLEVVEKTTFGDKGVLCKVVVA